jgi:hypothetical protein
MTVIDIKSGHPEPWHRLQIALYILGKRNPEITFLEEGHLYFWRDRELPSVTTVLRDGKGNWYKPGSAERGASVHKMVTLYMQTILDEQGLDSKWQGYLAALKKFLSAIGPYQVEGVEEVVGDPDLGFAGRRDLVIDYPGGPLGIVLYLSAKGTYKADTVTATTFNALKLEAINRVVEHLEKERVRL